MSGREKMPQMQVRILQRHHFTELNREEKFPKIFA